MERLVVGISGASGSIYGVRLLQALRDLPVEVHLVVSEGARRVVRMEGGADFAEVEMLADQVYSNADVSATIASGSFRTTGMVVVPCSIKSLSSIANSYNDNLLTRAADVTLKEGRKLVLMVRETPLHLGHLRLMTRVAEMGGVILPSVPAFYHGPETIEDLVDQSVGEELAEELLPHAATVFYAADRSLRLICLSREGSRHVEHLRGSSAVAGTVTGSHEDWKEIQGIQFWGKAVVLEGGERVIALAVYVSRFPFVKDLLSTWKTRGEMRDLAVFRIRLQRVALTDNTTGVFGREVLDLDEGILEERIEGCRD